MAEQLEERCIERHLYRRKYQTATGNWSTLYYARFKDWKGKRRLFPLGEKLDSARDKLGVLHKRNDAEFDFDKEKAERKKAERAMNLAEWLERYLELTKPMPSWKTKKAQCAHLKRLLGALPLSEVNRVRIIEYKNRRLSEPIIRQGRPVEGTSIMGATVNREVGCLRHALNLAADEGLCEGPPRVKKEKENARDRILDAAEYQALLDVSPRWLQRVLIAANEAALDRGVLFNLTWNSVKNGLIKIGGGREKTGGRQVVGISPALDEVLTELRAEYRRIPNTDRRVFTKNGKPIKTMRHDFDKAVKNAKIEDFQFRDFRHCARTRWGAAGLPVEIAEIAMGHKLGGMVGRYTNPTDEHIREAFRKIFPLSCTHEKNEPEESLSREKVSS